MRLDRSEPYGQIYGDPPVAGALYEQRGCYFRADGSLIGEPSAEPPERDAPAASDDYRSMSNERLRKVAAMYQLEWTTRNDVIRQLEGRP